MIECDESGQKSIFWSYLILCEQNKKGLLITILYFCNAYKVVIKTCRVKYLHWFLVCFNVWSIQLQISDGENKSWPN